MSSTGTDITRALRAEVGDDLRIVGEYTADGYEVSYARADVESKVMGEMAEQVHGECVLHGINSDYLEDLFELGELRTTAHRFRGGTVYHCVRSDLTGVIVSVESDADLGIDRFEAICSRSP